MKIGMIFPGQGAQFLGMAKEMYDRERIVQEYFEQASSCLEQNFVRLCFASSERELRETVNAQTSIFLVSAALTILLKEKYQITPDIVAGHSSGEYAAIFAAGGMNFADALYLLKKRSLFMEEATHEFPGSMIAVVGLPHDDVKEICDRYDDPDDITHVAEIVNFNSPQQFVVSGTTAELESVTSDVRAAGGKVLPLNVSGAFHSRLMRKAEELFSAYMVKVDFKDLAVPLVNNINAQLVTVNEQIKESVVKQMSGHVLWWPSMQNFKDCDIIVEVGPQNKLSKILKREWPDKKIASIGTPGEFEMFLSWLGKDVEKSELEIDLEVEKQEKNEAKLEPKTQAQINALQDSEKEIEETILLEKENETKE